VKSAANYTWNTQYTPYEQEYIDRAYDGAGGRLIFLWCGYFCLNCGGFKDFAKIHEPAV
jgi:hypothetical protein